MNYWILLKENFLEDYELLQDILLLKQFPSLCWSLFNSYHPHNINIKTLNVLMGWKDEGKLGNHQNIFTCDNFILQISILIRIQDFSSSTHHVDIRYLLEAIERFSVYPLVLVMTKLGLYTGFIIWYLYFLYR